MDLEHIESVLLDPAEREQYDVMLAEVGADSSGLGLMAGSAWEMVSPKGPVYLEQTIGDGNELNVDFATEEKDEEEEELREVLGNQNTLSQWMKRYIRPGAFWKWCFFHIINVVILDVWLNQHDPEASIGVQLLFGLFLGIGLAVFSYYAVEHLVRMGVPRPVPAILSFVWFLLRYIDYRSEHFVFFQFESDYLTILTTLLSISWFFVFASSIYGLVIKGARQPL